VRQPASYGFSGGATHQGAEAAQASFSGGQGYAAGMSNGVFSSNLNITQSLDPYCGTACGDQRGSLAVGHQQFAAGESHVTTGTPSAGATSGAVSATSGTAAMNRTGTHLQVQRLRAPLPAVSH